MTTIDLTTEGGIIQYMKAQGYECSTATRLTGGSCGFVYKAYLSSQQESVIIKHVEGYAARAPEWKLNKDRMSFEHNALQLLSKREFQTAENSVAVPTLIDYDETNHILVMGDANSSLPTLKTWLSSTSPIKFCTKIGEALGRYLANVHNRTASDNAVKLNFNGNETAKYLSGTLYFGGLPKAAESHGYIDPFFRVAAEVGHQEVLHSNDVLTLGDFWTGNVLVDHGEAEHELKLTVLDFELSKPGTAEFDVGQMAAEMYCLSAFRDQERGSALLDSFLKAYRQSRNVDAAKVAIRIGAHLFVIMPSAWSTEASQDKIEDALAIGAELVRIGVEKDVDGLRGSMLHELFSN